MVKDLKLHKYFLRRSTYCDFEYDTIIEFWTYEDINGLIILCKFQGEEYNYNYTIFGVPYTNFKSATKII